MTQEPNPGTSSKRPTTLLESIPIQCVALAFFFWCYHRFLISWMRETSMNLGAVKFHRHYVPLYAIPQVNLDLWIAPALAVMSVYLVVCRKLLLRGSAPTVWVILVSMVCFLAVGVSVGMIDGYREVDGREVAAPLEPYTRTHNEYYGDVPKVDAVGFGSFLRDYAKPELFSRLSGHARTHPPGGVLFLWFVSKIFGYSLLSAAVASIVFTSSTVLPIYLLAKTLYGESVGRYALALFLVMPNFVMFTTTSMDGPFTVFPIWSVYLFFRTLSVGKLVRGGILTGIALGLGMLMTYSTVFVGLFFTTVALPALLVNRRQFRQIVTLISIAGAAFAVFYLMMFLLAGFNLLEALRASIEKDQAGMGTGYETAGRYFHLSFANLFAFLIGAGIAMTTLWLRQTVRAIRSARRGVGVDVYVISYLISLLIIAFSTLYTMEVERIWIFMAPFVVIPGARCLHDLCERRQSQVDFYWVIGLLCAQLIFSEVMLYTYW